MFQDLHAQVGIGTTSPEAALDINSLSNGLLIPRVSLGSLTDTTTVQNPNGGSLAVSTLVYNDGSGGLSDAGFYYWNGASWVKVGAESSSAITGLQFYSFDNDLGSTSPAIDNPRTMTQLTNSGIYTGTMTIAAAGGAIRTNGTDGFTARFMGTYEVQNAGTFNFTISSDEGSSLYIDGMLVIDNWFDQNGSNPRTGSITLSAGKHKFEFWYYTNDTFEDFTFSWGTNPDGNTGNISASQFIVE
ncbi:hypothetical protein GWK08_04535 [Leptobacterium flavescens]|uniref:PA14 domain-containing protein n=1 Tax=Leptobacterium flavescens TaxID=472055 RepID=A0A6P0UQL8_9FLAO|nr:PA14 domain-containing protein [Leptobacterium flavescens]NER12696.1 hypothetical protein [Leptobacterium flavescens]